MDAGLAKRKETTNLLDELLEAGAITEQQYAIVKKEAQRTGKPERTILVELGFLTEDEINTFLALRSANYLPDVSDIIPDPKALSLVSPSFAKANKIVPIWQDEDTVTVLTSDPNNIVAQDQIASLTGKRVKVLVTKEENIIHIINTLYDKITDEAQINQIVKQIEEMVESGTSIIGEEAPVVKLFNWMIIDAIKKRATDIHIEPSERVTLIRYRIDGILHMTLSMPKIVHSPLVARVKILSGLDISETRLPQDGKISFRLGTRKIDLRISTFPTKYGESIAIRILDRSLVPLNIRRLGMRKDILEQFEEMINQSYKLILVTGPTGSGKTTTLYSALLSLSTIEKNIMTIEDPIEYELPLINQSQVNEKAGFDFYEGIKHILRHDPDIILIGEIRDKKTADMAIRAALTGHLVLSTLHTTNAPSAITRLIEMGVEPYLVASSLLGVLSQRLVRKICPSCKQEYKPSKKEMEILAKYGFEVKKLWRGKGCKKCLGTGYSGRTGIFEIMRMNPELEEAALAKAPTSQLEKIAQKYGYKPLVWDGLAKAVEGITTVEEVLRVV